MSLDDYRYKNFTYVAGDWTGDKAAIDKLYEWNEGKKWGLSFKDIHSETQSSDTSHNCSIKASLRKRMKLCKKFVLVVGSGTDSLKSGACYTCFWYKKPDLNIKEHTLSPWIYEEATFINNIQPILLSRFVKPHVRVFCEGGNLRINDSSNRLMAQYDIDLKNFTHITAEDLENHTGTALLDTIYAKYKIKKPQVLWDSE